MANPPDIRDTPNRLPWPPIIFGVAALGGWLANMAVPLPWEDPQALRFVGVAVMALGLGLDLTAMRQMQRSGANIRPNRAATALVTDGVFAMSRNPIYLGNTILLAGAGLAFAIYWLLPTAFLAAAMVTELAISREEAHLAAKFGGQWVAYAQKTRRWI